MNDQSLEETRLKLSEGISKGIPQDVLRSPNSVQFLHYWNVIHHGSRLETPFPRFGLGAGYVSTFCLAHTKVLDTPPPLPELRQVNHVVQTVQVQCALLTSSGNSGNPLEIQVSRCQLKAKPVSRPYRGQACEVHSSRPIPHPGSCSLPCDLSLIPAQNCPHTWTLSLNCITSESWNQTPNTLIFQELAEEIT